MQTKKEFINKKSKAIIKDQYITGTMLSTSHWWMRQ